MTMHRTPIIATLILGGVTLVSLTAAPIVPRYELPPDVRSTANLRELVLAIPEIPASLEEAGIRRDEVTAIWHRKLKEAGFVLVEKDAPRLRLTIRHLEDEDVPDAAGLLAMLLFEQDVSITRLDQRLTLPSYTAYAAGIDARSQIRESFEPAIHGMLDNFIDAVRDATEDRRRREAME